ncbi:MAG: hypothetical protein BAJALOKI3v1_110074 [Promethearchaeota archaeon]|nr:MAG: hypothetical protein BAJALOKI3v1_110074 [Candidatus Lokiarchaeota archaeon]
MRDKIFFEIKILINMDPEEKHMIAKEIVRERRLPYSIEVVEENNNKYRVINNFGSETTYIKKDGHYFLEDELE